MSKLNSGSATYLSYDHNYVITVTSGAYEDYEHGALFAVPSEEQAIYVTDLLNKYAAFRARFREMVWEWEFQHAANTQAVTDKEPVETQLLLTKEEIKNWARQKFIDRKRFIDENYAITEELEAAETLLTGTYLTNNDPSDWEEDVVFAYQALPVHHVDINIIEGFSGNTEQI